MAPATAPRDKSVAMLLVVRVVTPSEHAAPQLEAEIQAVERVVETLLVLPVNLSMTADRVKNAV